MTAWSELPLIHDAAFYAVAVPAVLMMGLSKSGFLGGFGSLAVPLMALAIPVPQAAAIMLPLLLVMDATGLQQLWRHCDRDLLRLLLPAGLLGTVVGTVLFGVLSTATVAAVVGALTLLFLAQRLLFPPRADSPPPPPSNQIIHVRPREAAKGVKSMDAVWISGTLKTLRSDTFMGASSYRLEAVAIEIYTEKK